MVGFITKLFPNTAESLSDTAYALTNPSDDGFMQGGLGLGALIGGGLGLAAGVAATVFSAFSAPVSTLLLLHLGIGAAAPIALGVGGGLLGTGIGYGVAALARIGLGGIGAAFSAAMDIGDILEGNLSSRTKSFFRTGAKWGLIGGAVVGLALGVAAFAAAPALMTGLGIITSIASNGFSLMGLGALLSLPVSGVAKIVDKITGREPPLNGLAQDAVKKMVETRKQRLSNENLMEDYAGRGWMPHLKDALPQDVYARLSDAGKIAAMDPVFDARGDELGDFKKGDETKLKDVFGKFAENASKILATEQSREAALSPRQKSKAAFLAHARDRALGTPAHA